MLDQIQPDNADTRDGINKFVATICNDKEVFLEQVFNILFFAAVFVTNKSSFSLYFDKLLEERIHLSQLMTLSLQLSYVCHFCSFLNCLYEMVRYVLAGILFLVMYATVVEYI